MNVMHDRVRVADAGEGEGSLKVSDEGPSSESEATVLVCDSEQCSRRACEVPASAVCEVNQEGEKNTREELNEVVANLNSLTPALPPRCNVVCIPQPVSVPGGGGIGILERDSESEKDTNTAGESQKKEYPVEGTVRKSEEGLLNDDGRCENRTRPLTTAEEGKKYNCQMAVEECKDAALPQVNKADTCDDKAVSPKANDAAPRAGDRPTPLNNSSQGLSVDQVDRRLKELQHRADLLTAQYARLEANRRSATQNAAEEEEEESIMRLEQEMNEMEESSRSSRPRIGRDHRATTTRVRAFLANQERNETWHEVLQLQEDIRRTTTVSWLLKRDSKGEDLQAVINPKYREGPRDAAEDDSDTEGREMARDILHIKLQLDQSDEGQEDSSQVFNSEDKTSAFFNSKGVKRYQATAMKLKLSCRDDPRTSWFNAVVDSGAAWCAIDMATFRRAFPNAKLKPTGRKFTDASSKLMDVRGSVDMNFWLGELELSTPVFVFANLGVPFLLGTNALDQHQLALSYSRHVIFSEAKEAAGKHAEAPLETTRPCEECPDSVAAIAEVEVETDAQEHFTRNCRCTSEKPVLITCDTTACCLMVKTTDGRVREYGCEPMAPRDVTVTPSAATQIHASHIPLRSSRDYRIRPGDTVDMRLLYDQYLEGDALSHVDLELDEGFVKRYMSVSPSVEAPPYLKVNLMNATVGIPMTNVTNRSGNGRAVVVPAGTTIYRARKVGRSKDPVSVMAQLSEQDEGVIKPPATTPLALRVREERRASPTTWMNIGREQPVKVISCLDGEHDIPYYHTLKCGELAKHLPEKQEFSSEECQTWSVPSTLTLSHCILADDGNYYIPTMELPFSEGGRPTNRADLKELGLDFDKCIDPSQPRGEDGNYPPLPEESKQQLYDIALRWWYVWSRDARTPALSRLVVLDIPTGDASPVAQKPYPLPYQYLEAVRTEVQKLLDGGLIEPCISNWASPVLVRLKKDSTPEAIKLKLIIDLRRLNEVTVPDVAGLGDQDEILDGFGGDQRYCGICDAAGGFYQYLLTPSCRHKTAFCLPTSMGGTSFQWRVAPYGLTRNPAGYSRGMMYALKGLDSCQLPGGEGGAKSWIDDISMHSNSFESFAALFDLILGRMASASMSLKASKCYLLHQRLEVLGFYVTPDGIVMQNDKLDDFANYNKNGVVGPRNVEEIRKFLGAVQFYRRFIPRLSMLAAPMNDMLKKKSETDPVRTPGTPAHQAAWEGVRQSYEAILMFLKSDAVVSAPDLKDPLAEYVICTDACNVAAGGVLLQWQWRKPGPSARPPPGTPLRGMKGPDPLHQSWRLEAGWELRTIAYYSKTFDSAQRRYATFDQESAAILLCCRKWAKLITCRPTTIYTDSAVAASMLTKHLGPPRLQRWGMELGTFMPYLKICYRKGVDNGMADFLSRYPTFSEYVPTVEGVAYLPDDMFNEVHDIPLFTHTLGDDENSRSIAKWRYKLLEAKRPQELEAIWQAQAGQEMLTSGTTSEGAELLAAVRELDDASLHHARQLPSISASLQLAQHTQEIPSMIAAVREAAQRTTFWKEQTHFEEIASSFDLYVSAFTATHGRPPVVYDLFCGEGGFSRGARASGCDCIGFDSNEDCGKRYEQEPLPGGGKVPSCMTFVKADIMNSEFWENLKKGVKHNGEQLPRPDVIHASPPCKSLTRVASANGHPDEDPGAQLRLILTRLKELERHSENVLCKPLVWQVENVPESENHVADRTLVKGKLCGTMMGHYTFRHRVFYCNYGIDTDLPHDHTGKIVGTRNIRFAGDEHRYAHLPDPNMYGVYSKPYHTRGTSTEWHGALGANPGTYSVQGLANALPLGYGRLLSCQMIAHLMKRLYQMPVYPIAELNANRHHLSRWAEIGYRPLSEVHHVHENCKSETLHMNLSDIADIATQGEPPPGDHISPEEEHCPLASDELARSPYSVTLFEQLKDPNLRSKIDLLKAPEKNYAGKAVVPKRWILKDDLLHYLEFNEEGQVTAKLAVPEAGRTAIMARYHYVNHRGHEPLANLISQSYYWPNMRQSCLDFVNTCKVCQPLLSRPLARAVTQPIPTPSKPFSVIHVDHKGPLRKSGEFFNILVVVCALTRYSLFIPVRSTTADETLRALNSRVFSVFGNPAVIVSDNGPAFVSELSEAASAFFGYRHIHCLPYNAQANGTAESAVKRIKLLLDRQTHGYENWHKLLPTMQQLLNATVHNGTGVTPFFALFGREPDGLERLENPALYPEGDGHEFLTNLKGRLISLHKELQKHSDAIKMARSAEKNAREYANLHSSRFGIVKASTPDQPRYVWMIHGSKEQAAYTRKHGHGAPWKHKYKVLEVKPHAVRLEIPTDGSAPRVNEWQLIRKVHPAAEGEHAPDLDSPFLTETGIPVTRDRMPLPAEASIDEHGELVFSDEVYDIEHVSHAEKVGDKFKIWIKWRDYDELTWEWQHSLEYQSCNNELLGEITRAVDKELTRLRCQHPSHAATEDVPIELSTQSLDSGIPPTTPQPVLEERLSAHGRPVRQRAQAVQHNVGTFLLTEDSADTISLHALVNMQFRCDCNEGTMITDGALDCVKEKAGETSQATQVIYLSVPPPPDPDFPSPPPSPPGSDYSYDSPPPSPPESQADFATTTDNVNTDNIHHTDDLNSIDVANMDDLVSFEEDETFALSRIRAEHLSGISLKAYDELLTKYLDSDRLYGQAGVGLLTDGTYASQHDPVHRLAIASRKIIHVVSRPEAFGTALQQPLSISMNTAVRCWVGSTWIRNNFLCIVTGKGGYCLYCRIRHAPTDLHFTTTRSPRDRSLWTAECPICKLQLILPHAILPTWLHERELILTWCYRDLLQRKMGRNGWHQRRLWQRLGVYVVNALRIMRGISKTNIEPAPSELIPLSILASDTLPRMLRRVYHHRTIEVLLDSTHLTYDSNRYSPGYSGTSTFQSDLPLANKYPWLGYLWETADSPAELARRHAVPLSRMTAPTFDTVWRRSANHTHAFATAPEILTLGMTDQERYELCSRYMRHNFNVLWNSVGGVCLSCELVLQFNQLEWGDDSNKELSDASPWTAVCPGCRVDCILPFEILPLDVSNRQLLLTWCHQDRFTSPEQRLKIRTRKRWRRLRLWVTMLGHLKRARHRAAYVTFACGNQGAIDAQQHFEQCLTFMTSRLDMTDSS